MKVKGVGEFLVISPRGKERQRNANESSARLVNCTRVGWMDHHQRQHHQQTSDMGSMGREGFIRGGGGRDRENPDLGGRSIH